MEGQKRWTGPGGITLVADRSQVFPDDPGAGTPIMVYSVNSNEWATLGCAMDTGVLSGMRGDVDLTETQARWLDEFGPIAEEFVF